MQQGVGGSGALQQSSSTLSAMLMPRAACRVLSILFGTLLNISLNSASLVSMDNSVGSEEIKHTDEHINTAFSQDRGSILKQILM